MTIKLTDEQWKQYLKDGQRFLIEQGPFEVAGTKMKAVSSNYIMDSQIVKVEAFIIPPRNTQKDK